MEDIFLAGMLIWIMNIIKGVPKDVTLKIFKEVKFLDEDDAVNSDGNV